MLLLQECSVNLTGQGVTRSPLNMCSTWRSCARVWVKLLSVTELLQVLSFLSKHLVDFALISGCRRVCRHNGRCQQTLPGSEVVAAWLGGSGCAPCS